MFLHGRYLSEPKALLGKLNGHGLSSKLPASQGFVAGGTGKKCLAYLANTFMSPTHTDLCGNSFGTKQWMGLLWKKLNHSGILSCLFPSQKEAMTQAGKGKKLSMYTEVIIYWGL